MAKDSEFTPVLQKALQSLIDDGTYTKILSKWGVESGGVKKADLNAKDEEAGIKIIAGTARNMGIEVID